MQRQENKMKDSQANIAKAEIKQESKIENKKLNESKQPVEIKEENKIENSNEKKSEPKKETSKKTEKQDDKKIEKSKPKKIEAIVNGRNLGISTKHSIAICDFIRNKRADEAIRLLEEVSRIKRAVPMKGEIPHRKGKGMMSGRYPVNASKEFIKLLKQLIANAIVNGIELEKAVIWCKANRAPRPMRRFGRFKFKRSHISLKLIIPKEKKKKTSKRKLKENKSGEKR